MFYILSEKSDFLGQNINDYIHLIFPHDPLAARLMSWPSKTASLWAVSMFIINVYYGLVWLVVPFVFMCDLGAQTAHRDRVFDGLLMWRAASGSGGKIRSMG